MFINNFKNKPVIIAEAGVNHNGNFELAKKLVFAAADAKADIIKFQTFKHYECAGKYSDCAPYQKNSNNQSELLKSLELPFECFAELKKLAESLDLEFLSTPDGKESLEYLCSIGIKAIKIGSGELNNHSFLKLIGSKKLPVILSTGMGTLDEVEAAFKILSSEGATEISILHCTSEYPAPDDEMNLLAIETIFKHFGLPTGLSDHSKSNEAAIAATALKAQIIEKHLTLDCNMHGPDHKASLNPKQFKDLTKAIRKTALMLGSAVKKPTKSELKNINLVRRSIVASCDLEAGTNLTKDFLCFKRPGWGIAPSQIEQVIGRTLKLPLNKDEPLTWAHLES